MAKRQRKELCNNDSDEDRLVIQEILAGPSSGQYQAAGDYFQKLLESACQPRHMSKNACVRLCYFLEICRKSSSPNMQNLAYSGSTCMKLFHFYMEWNEKNQHRSMRQIVELFVSLIMSNSDKTTSEATKLQILQKLLLIINHRSVQSFVKPAFKVLEVLLTKGAITIDELCRVQGSRAYHFEPLLSTQKFHIVNDIESLVFSIFDWMSSPDTTSAASRLLVTLFETTGKESLTDLSGSVGENRTSLWERWIRQGLIRYPDSLENVKNHLFPQLFKIDHAGALEFLRDLCLPKSARALTSEENDGQAILLLSAVEVGKRCGLIDEQDDILVISSKTAVHSKTMNPESSGRITFSENIIGGFLKHNRRSLRSLAFSVLVSSRSSISPFTPYSLRLLKSNLVILHADSDAKFRNEVLSNTKHLLKRLKGAMSSLTRALYLVAPSHSTGYSTKKRANLNVYEYELLNREQRKSLDEHRDFIEWYQCFLEQELVPTASYQRHIMSLRAFQLAISSGIFTADKEPSLNARIVADYEWPYSFTAFTKSCIRLLLDLLMNPFEDVRNTASDLLRLAPRSCFVDWEHGEEPKTDLEDSVFFRTNLIGRGTVIDHRNYLQNREDDGGMVNSHEISSYRLLNCFAKHAEDASTRTGRADLADGVSRTNELLCRLAMNAGSRFILLNDLISDLETRVVRAELSLAEAVLTAPIHGKFASVRLVYDALSQSPEEAAQLAAVKGQATNVAVSEYRALESRMVRCCQRIWQSVRDILCNDSPEGHLPIDLDHIDVLDTKDILSYGFRAIHESSLLLRVMAQNHKRLFNDGDLILPTEIFCEAGDLTFDQLSNLRHRGVFSTVSLTFATYCQIGGEIPILGVSGKPLTEEWYLATLNCMFEQTSTTRRSAGIPALITGILSAYSSSPPFEDVMKKLKELAEKPILLADIEVTTLSQVHAFNSLKEIFKSSTLGRRCERHIADCLKLAAESLQSKVWAIRNCALLLLRSLIDCLISTSDNRTTAETGWDGKSVRLSYERYPALPELLLHLLDVKAIDHSVVGSAISKVECVFPALDILRRAGPPRSLRKEVYYSVSVHLGSQVWSIREIAARTICTLLLDGTWQSEISKLVECIGGSANRVHGTLLAIKFLVERRLELGFEISSENLSCLTRIMKQFWARKAPWRMCAPIKAAYEDVMTIITKTAYINQYSSVIDNQDIESSDLGFASLTRDVTDKASHILKVPDYSLTKSKIDSGADSSLLLRASAIRVLHEAAFNGGTDLIFELIDFVARVDIDVTISIVENVPLVWDVRSRSTDILKTLVGIYTRILGRGSSSCMRHIILRNLADVIEPLCENRVIDPVISTMISKLDAPLHLFDSPDLSKAEIRISGSILAQRFALGIGSPGVIDEQVQTWGHMLISCGNTMNDIEIRCAAVAALRAFYGAFGPGPSVEAIFIMQNSVRCCFLPSLLVLYDLLNDDDDEIRDIAAKVVYHILGTHWVPPAACREYLIWLERLFGETEAFCDVVLQRITGNDSACFGQLDSVEAQLAEAMVDDDALFIEEKQNLYRDEVRETLEWTSILSNARGPCWDSVRTQLTSWALEGLGTLERLTKVEHESYGWWTSKPKVFAIFMTILLTSKTLLGRHEDSYPHEIHLKFSMDIGGLVTKQTRSEVVQNDEDLHRAMKSFLEIGRKKRLHPLLL